MTVELIVLAAAGGAFGASIGALPSFALAGLFVVFGEIADLTAGATGANLPVDITGTIGFGVVLGPHVAFGGGAAALAYAAKRGYADGIDAKAVTRGLGNRPDVLAVGAAFGIVGHLVATASAGLSVPVDPVALGVVGSALLHRAVFGYHIVAAPTPVFEPGQTRADGGSSTDHWLSYQQGWAEVATLGVVMGLLGGYLAYLTASPFLAFGLSVVALALLCAGVSRIPVTHHMTLPASTATLALVGPGALTPSAVTGVVPLWAALVVGAAFGLGGALAGELLQRVFYARGETHLDPPAASIVVTSLCIAFLAMMGILPSAVWIPLP